MIISRSPYRVSLFGGGTDYPSYYKQYSGIVVGCAIAYYSYLTCRLELPFHTYRSHVSYSKIEQVNDNKKIKHRAIRHVLEYLNVEEGISVTHLGDLPARSGLGSSSTFIVGLLQAVSALKGQLLTKKELVDQSIFIERVLMDEVGGVQDNVWASFGGFNQIDFKAGSEAIVINPLIMDKEFIKSLESSMFLLFTGISRVSSKVAKSYAEDYSGEKLLIYDRLKDIAKNGADAIKGQNIREACQLLDDNWREKKSLSKEVSNGEIDDIYNHIQFLGGSAKLLGSGGGGFMLVMSEDKDNLAKLKGEFKKGKKIVVDMKFDFAGSQIIFNA